MATSDEFIVAADEEQSIRAILDRAANDLASWNLAEMSDLSAEVCGMWINHTYNGLRELDEDQRLIAIAMLLHEEAHRRALNIKCRPLDMDALG